MKYILLILIGLALFIPALPNKFVWDDEEQVVANTAVHSMSNIPQLLAGSTFNSGGSSILSGLYYKPLMSISFAVLYTFFGPSPWAFHLFQILLHIASTLLLFTILGELWKNKWLAFFASALFLVHPMNVETVVYVSSLQDTLYMFFGLLGLTWLVISEKRIGWGDLAFTATCLFLSLLGKETGILFLPLTGLYLFLYRSKKDILRFSISTLAVLALYAYLRLGLAGVGLGKNMFTPMATLPLVTRLGNIPAIVWHYMTTWIYPAKLAISQHWFVASPDIFSSISLLLLIATWLYILRLAFHYKERTLVFFWLWFGASLAFHLHIFPLDMTVADRWFYLPMIGLIGSIGSIDNKILRHTKVVILIVISILILLGIRSTYRIRDWRDGLTLYRHDIQMMPDSFDLQNNLGVELYREGKTREAAVHFARSTEIAPSWWTNWNNLGVTKEAEGELELALSYYKKSIDNGGYYLAYGNYGRLLIKMGRVKDTREFVSNSLLLYPNNMTLLELSRYLDILEKRKGENL